MTTLDIREIGDGDVDAVIVLWERCNLLRPWNDPYADIAFARANGNATILIGRIAGEADSAIAASTIVGHDGHRGAVYYVSVDPDHRGHGFGRDIMGAAEAWLREHGVWKLNLMVRADNDAVVDFYTAIGFDREQRVNFAKWIDPSRKPDRKN